MKTFGKWLLRIIILTVVFLAGMYVYESKYFLPEVKTIPESELVRQAPSWWKYSFFFKSEVASAVYPYIYLPKDEFEIYKTGKPTKEILSEIVKEKIQLQAQRDMGPFRYELEYLLSKKFRFDNEITAITAQIEYLKKNGEKFDIDAKAKELSSSLYLWAESYENAKTKLDTIWNDVKVLKNDIKKK